MRILVTGGGGMVGKHLQEILPNAIFLSRFHENGGDLRDPEYVKWFLSSYTPEAVVHLAAKVGGIQDNIKYPANYFDDNILINTNVLKYSHQCGVKRFIGILSTCAYPDVVPNYPMHEKDLFTGPPAKSNFSYGYAKRCMAVQIEAYNQQYNTDYNYLLPCNLYSEHDNFTNISKMHFVTALLHKIKHAKNNTIELLGDGTPLRQFMYAGDLARVIKEILDKNITDNLNVACPENLSIREMAEIALSTLGKPYTISYINPTLNGQYRKDVSTDKLNSLLPDFRFTPFAEGIKQVYNSI